MPAPVLQVKRGALSNLPGLKAGEPAFTTDTFDFFVGIDSTTNNNKFLGSYRYWTKETSSVGSSVKLVEGTTNGSNYVALKAPDNIASNVTYVLPGTQGANTTVLTNDGSGNLSWASGSANPVFTGIATFTGTEDNTLGNPDTGAVQIDGGLGINKNVTIGAGLSVSGASYFIGTATFYGGQLNLGDSDTDNISVAGEFVSNLVPNATNTYDLGLTGKRWRNGFYGGNLDVTGNLTVNGNVTVGGGTTVILYGQDVFIKNKDIILGYTTSVTGSDASTDDSANHAGVAIASTVGSPLCSFAASGINTLPDTYKQLMWFRSGTLGFSTDAFAFNYGLAIGTTSMANGVRLAVGTGVQVTDTQVTATTFSGSLNGTAASADQIKTVGTSNNTDYYVTFVDGPITGESGETLRVGAGLSVNPSTGAVRTKGILSVGDPAALTSYIKAGGGSNALYIYNNGDVSFQAKAIVNEIRSSSNASTLITLSDLDATFARDINVTGIATVGTFLKAPTVKATNVQANDGTTSITITNGTGAVGFANSVTIAGDLYVLGSTTEVNTSTLKVEDSLIDLGLINSNGSLIPPTSDLNIDIGVLFNWYGGSAKKASVYWDDSAQRIGIASDVTESTGVLTANAYAAVEIGALWVTDCAGTSQVISCTGSERFLENITVDCGTF